MSVAGTADKGFKQRDHAMFDDRVNSSVDLIFAPTPASQELAPYDISVLTEQFRAPPVTDWTIPQAFLCLLLSAAVSDGHLAPEEQAEIHCLSMRSRALKSLDASTLAAINSEVTKRLKERPRGLQEACYSLPNDLRLPIFGHCVEVVLADGVLLQPEIEFLNKITAYLELPPEEAQFILKALLIKNRC